MDLQLGCMIFISGLIYAGYHDVGAMQLPVQLWKKMTSANSTQEFLERFIRKANDSSRLHQDEYDKRMENILFTMQGSLKKSGVGVASSIMAVEDGCSPKPRSVRIPAHPDPSVLHWPSCTRVPQCGGCCGHDSLQCLPRRKQEYAVMVMRARHPEPGVEYFIFEGMDTVSLEQHLECECKCKTQATDCNPLLHTYDQDACQCRCNSALNATSCPPNQYWEHMQCACLCKNTPSCHSDEVFNKSTCRCDDKPKNKKPESAMDHADPCFEHECRPGYVPRRFGSRCRCEFNMHQVIAARSRDTVAAGIPILPHYLPASTSQHSVNRYPGRRV